MSYVQIVGFRSATDYIKDTSNKLPYLQSCQHPEKDWWHKAVVIGSNVVVVLNIFICATGTLPAHVSTPVDGLVMN